MHIKYAGKVLGACLIFMPDTCEKGLQVAREVFIWGERACCVSANFLSREDGQKCSFTWAPQTMPRAGLSAGRHGVLRLGAPVAITDVLNQGVKAIGVSGSIPAGTRPFKRGL